MEWYYDGGGQQSGPVTDSQLDDLLRTGAIQSETLVWRSGMADWQPLHVARPSTSAGAPPPVLPSMPPIIGGPLATVCVECQRPFPQGEMVMLNKAWVCAQCKPIFLQRLMEGSAPGGSGTAGGLIWRFDRQMVTRSDTPMPDRCIKCNAPAKGFRLKRQLSWHPPAYFLLLLVSILIYVIVAMIIRKKATLYIGLCDTHRAQRNRYIMLSWLIALLGLGVLFAAAAWNKELLFLPGILLFLAGIIVGVVKVPMITAAKIDNEFVWVKGADQSFLAQLPEWYGPR
jgi:hypothetical protein